MEIVGRTRDSAAEPHLDGVPAPISSSEVKRHVQITNEVDQEFQGFVRGVGIVCSVYTIAVVGSRRGNPVAQNVRRISDGSEHVAALAPGPASPSGEEARVGWVITQSANVM